MGMSLLLLASVSYPTRYAYEQAEVSVDGEEVAVPEEKELDLPETDVTDPEGVGSVPIPAVCQGDVESRPGRTVGLDGLVVTYRGVIDDQQADEVDANGIAHARGLVIH